MEIHPNNQQLEQRSRSTWSSQGEKMEILAFA